MLEKTVRKTRANAKRKALADGRNRSLDETSPNAQGIGGHDVDQVGAAFQNAGRTLSSFTATGDTPKRSNRRNRDNERSSVGLVERERRSDRRPQESHGGAIADSTADENVARPKREQHAVEVGRFATDEIINEPEPFKLDITPDGTFASPAPELSKYKEDYRRTTREGANVYAMIDYPSLYVTSDEYKALASRKDATPEPVKQKMWKQGKVLSKQEAEDFYEPVMVALPQGGEYLDKFLWQSCPQLDERPIWSNLTEIECKAICKLLLRRAQVDPMAATVVRAVVDSADYITVIVALGSRGLETGKAIRERPRVERKKKFSPIRTIGGENAN